MTNQTLDQRNDTGFTGLRDNLPETPHGESADRDSGKRNDDQTGVSDLFSSMIGFATATTKFTIHQMQNAVVAITEPRSAMSRVRQSIDNLSQAMCSPVGKGASNGRQGDSGSEPVSAADAFDRNGGHTEDEDALSGRKR